MGLKWRSATFLLSCSLSTFGKVIHPFKCFWVDIHHRSVLVKLCCYNKHTPSLELIVTVLVLACLILGCRLFMALFHMSSSFQDPGWSNTCCLGRDILVKEEKKSSGRALWWFLKLLCRYGPHHFPSYSMGQSRSYGHAWLNYTPLRRIRQSTIKLKQKYNLSQLVKLARLYSRKCYEFWHIAYML